MRISRTVIETDDQSLKSFELVFEHREDQERFLAAYRPGQFCQLSIFGKGEAPFGVASAAWEGNLVRFTVNKIGVFTTALHALKPGDSLGMRGPLGHGYPLDAWKGANLLIIGGGYAFTTLYALTLHLICPDVRPSYAGLTVLYGARQPGLFLYQADLTTWYERKDLLFYQTIDQAQEGWDHFTGYVPDLLKKLAPSSVNTVAVVCGPPVMISLTLPVLRQLGFAAECIFTSLEKRMKCGLGKCGRCNIGSEYICTDGPVFSLAQLQKLTKDF